MKRTVIGFVFVFLMSTIACASVWAQATAQIGGTVRDLKAEQCCPVWKLQ
jgi:hypothetical protein